MQNPLHPANDRMPPFVLPLARRETGESRFLSMTVGLLALVHAIILASLLVVLMSIGSRAFAQEATPSDSCGGENIVARMARDAPDRLSQIEAEAAETLNGEGRFWKIERDGLEPSWLYGTMHVADPRVLELGKDVEAAFGAASVIVIETDEIVDPERSQAAIFANPELTMFTDGTTLETLMSAEDYARVERELKEVGVPIAAVSRMKPWMIASLVALPECELARKADGAAFLDKKLADDALAAGKELKGLETVEEQLTAMAGLPMEFHIRGLIETISLGPLLDDVMATMTDLYVEGRIGMIMPMIRAAAPPSSEETSEGYAAFEERIIHARNRVMAERAGPLLAEGDIFIAVGALHLPGEDGLIELLRAQGYSVTRAD